MCVCVCLSACPCVCVCALRDTIWDTSTVEDYGCGFNPRDGCIEFR